MIGRLKLFFQLGSQLERTLEGTSRLDVPLDGAGKALWHRVLPELTGERLLLLQSQIAMLPAVLEGEDALLLQAWRIEQFQREWGKKLRRAWPFLISADVYPCAASVGDHGVVLPDTLSRVILDPGVASASGHPIGFPSCVGGALSILAQPDMTRTMYHQGDYVALFPWDQGYNPDTIRARKRQGESEWVGVWGACVGWRMVSTWVPLEAWVHELLTEGQDDPNH